MSYSITSESVARGHPDKIADQISDTIVDAFLREDPYAKVACETLITEGYAILAGEVASSTRVDLRQLMYQALINAGYEDPRWGFALERCELLFSLHQQSREIFLAMKRDGGASDQGIMYGYACDESDVFMPLPILLAHKLLEERDRQRALSWSFLGPDAKSQVTLRYEKGAPYQVDAIVLSSQHTADTSQETVHACLSELVKKTIPAPLLSQKTKLLFNPSQSFVVGGPSADTGLTGRKIMVDTYGGVGRHGGGAFSGKDPSKVDRSAAYMARYIAKNIVAAGLASRCEIHLAYAIGIHDPIDVGIQTFGTHKVDPKKILQAIFSLFDLTPEGIVRSLDLRRPIYTKTSWGGHFGRSLPEFTWEKLDKVEALLQVID